MKTVTVQHILPGCNQNYVNYARYDFFSRNNLGILFNENNFSIYLVILSGFVISFHFKICWPIVTISWFIPVLFIMLDGLSDAFDKLKKPSPQHGFFFLLQRLEYY